MKRKRLKSWSIEYLYCLNIEEGRALSPVARKLKRRHIGHVFSPKRNMKFL